MNVFPWNVLVFIWFLGDRQKPYPSFTIMHAFLQQTDDLCSVWPIATGRTNLSSTSIHPRSHAPLSRTPVAYMLGHSKTGRQTGVQVVALGAVAHDRLEQDRVFLHARPVERVRLHDRVHDA